PLRARRLWEAAGRITACGWPDDLAELPGVGRYTALAVAVQVDGVDASPVETNVRRVVERRAGRQLTPSQAAAASAEAGRPLVGRNRFLALMDAGALLCRPRQPRCDTCPLRTGCATGAGEPPAVRPRRHAPFEGSFRQRR